MLQVASTVWNLFSARFISLWNEEGSGSGLLHEAVFGVDEAARCVTQTAVMRSLFSDALLFGGCEMIRRLVGIAHNADFERIEDADVRAVCERRALTLGRELLVKRQSFVSIEAVVKRADAIRQDGAKPCFPMMLEPPPVAT
jgi:5-methylthioribose kinase